jgi:hypothetical protein
MPKRLAVWSQIPARDEEPLQVDVADTYTRLSNGVVNKQCSIVADLLHDGFMDFYDGIQPSGPETTLDDQVYFGSVRFTGFTEPSGGVMHAFEITDGVSIESGTITWARLFRADHRTAVMDMSVGERDANIIVRSSTVERGATIQCASFEYEVPKSSPGI